MVQPQTGATAADTHAGDGEVARRHQGEDARGAHRVDRQRGSTLLYRGQVTGYYGVHSPQPRFQPPPSPDVRFFKGAASHSPPTNQPIV